MSRRRRLDSQGHKLKKEEGVIRRMLVEMTRSAQAGQQTRILLTGTPVQNDMVELWSLCNFIMPSVFHSRDEFKQIYTFLGVGSKAGTDYLREQEQKNRIISKLHALLSRYMLRRTKAEVHLSLPPKVEALVYTPLTREQIRILKAIDSGTLVDELKAMRWAPRKWCSAAI
jgi:SNF2 family DNA or RNA helicase